MIRSTLTSMMLAACVLMVSGCGGDEHSNASAPPAPQSLDTAQLLAIAQKTPEPALPFQVDGGLVTFSDTSETSLPISINQ